MKDRLIGFQSISDAIDTTTPQGRLFFNISACFAEFERDLMVFKTKAGQIGITNLQLIDYQYLESLVFSQVVFNLLFSNR